MRIVRIPSVAKTLVEAWVNLLSRSRIRAAKPVEHAADGEVAGLLGDPWPRRVARDAGKMDAPRLELDEEQHVDAAQQDRVDAEEVAGEDPSRLGVEELAPGRPVAARRWLQSAR